MRPIHRSARASRELLPTSISTFSLAGSALANPIMVASGTFGYAREMAGLVDARPAGGDPAEDDHPHPRPGNAPGEPSRPPAGCSTRSAWTTTGSRPSSSARCPICPACGTAIVVSIAGKNHDEFVEMAALLDPVPGVAAIELNISCPNVSGGVDFGTDPPMCQRVVADVRAGLPRPILAKLTPNVTASPTIARAAEAGGADAISLINTCLGMAVDWRRRRPLLGTCMGGLSGPAIKPIALRAVYQVAQAVKTPIVGIGGIATVDDVMEFLVAGATAVQVGTANFYNPRSCIEILDALPAALAELGATCVADVVGTLRVMSENRVAAGLARALQQRSGLQAAGLNRTPNP